MAKLVRKIMSGRKAAPLQPLYPSDDEEAPKEPHVWQVGARYEVLRPLYLHERPDPTSAMTGRLEVAAGALFMALSPFRSPDVVGEVLMGYLADTRSTLWMRGWAQFESSDHGAPAPVSPRPTASQSPGPPLAKRRLRNSWEFGGRYRVRNQLVLRFGVELESEALCELQKDDEVLIIEFGLVLFAGEPRLRARVRADSGTLGWLTVEVPESPPLLEPINLYSRAAGRSSLFGRPPCRAPVVKRRSISGLHNEEETWEVGGKYRTLAKTQLRKDAELNSPVLCQLKRGVLLFVQEIERVSWHPSAGEVLRLNVVHEEGQGQPPLLGWVSVAGSMGEPLLDVRDQLEYAKFMIAAHHDAMMKSRDPPDRDTSVFVVRFRRPSRDCPLGVTVDHSDGRSLVVQKISAGGLVDDWNQTCAPDERITQGDRIICVNQQHSSTNAMLDAMGGDFLELTIERSPKAHASMNREAMRQSDFEGTEALWQSGYEGVRK